MREYAARNAMNVGIVFLDHGISGHSGDARPAFDEAVAGLVRGDFDVLLVGKLDRLSRQGIGATGPLLDKLEGTGRRIVSVMDGVDTS